LEVEWGDASFQTFNLKIGGGESNHRKMQGFGGGSLESFSSLSIRRELFEQGSLDRGQFYAFRKGENQRIGSHDYHGRESSDLLQKFF